MSSVDVLPADSRLRAPNQPLPPGAVDCHAHIFDSRYGLSGDRKYSPPPAGADAWLALHAALGVERGVQVNATPYGFDNTITEDFLRAHRGRFAGVATIRPDIDQATLKRLDAAGFRAARLMDQFPNGATSAMLEDIARRVAPLGWHIEINIAKADDWVELEARLARCAVPLVFDHLGRPRGGKGVEQPGFRVIRRLLASRDDCWTKVSSFYRLSDSGPPHYADMRPFVEAVLKDRPDRCIWGTNWPHPGMTAFMPNDADLLDLLESWIPHASMRVPLFAANAARLYRL